MLDKNCTIDDCLLALEGLYSVFAKAQNEGGVKFDGEMSTIIATGLRDMIACLEKAAPIVRPAQDVDTVIDEIDRRLENLRQIDKAIALKGDNIIHFSDAARIAQKYRDSDALDRRAP